MILTNKTINIMKKLVITLLALVAIVTAVNAQGMSEEQREKTLYNLIVRMRPVGTQYAITTTPVTYKIQLIMMPAVAFFITTTSKSLILAVGYQPFTSHADTENSSVITPLPAGISITPVYISVLSRAVRL